MVNVLVPPVLLKVSVPDIVVVPVTLSDMPPTVLVPDTCKSEPETFNAPATELVNEEPPFNVNPPEPTLVVKADVQVAVPLILSERQFAGFPFIVMVFPEQIITLSAAPGIVAEATPPQEAVDQVDAVFQFPLTLE